MLETKQDVKRDLREYRDALLQEHPFITQWAMQAKLSHYHTSHHDRADYIGNAGIGEIASEVDYKVGLVPLERMRDYLVNRAEWRKSIGDDREQTRKSLSRMSKEYCKAPASEQEIESVLAEVYDGNNGNGNTIDLVEVGEMQRPVKERPYIVKGMVYKGYPAAIYGAGGTAKSYLALDIGCHVARGEKWLDFDVHQEKVLYLDFELDAEEMASRAWELADGEGFAAPPKGLYYLSGVGLSVQEAFTVALNRCRELGIRFVILDSLGYAIEGEAESSKAVLDFFREVEGAFRSNGITVMAIDHVPHVGEHMFGSVYKGNSFRSVFRVEKRDKVGNSLDVVLRHRKVNFGAELPPFSVHIKWDDDEGVAISNGGLDLSDLDEPSSITEKIKHYLRDNGASYTEEIADYYDLDIDVVKPKMTSLKKQGVIGHTGNKNAKNAVEWMLL